MNNFDKQYGSYPYQQRMFDPSISPHQKLVEPEIVDKIIKYHLFTQYGEVKTTIQTVHLLQLHLKV